MAEDVTMVERVARGIYEARNGAGAVPWGRRDQADKLPYLSEARAVIEAMREPTEAMIDEGNPYAYLGESMRDPKEVWQRMIDAALATPKGRE